MTKLSWDNAGDRLFEAGLDRGVLYLGDGSGVPWNGLVSADIGSESISTTPIYFDGAKTFDLVSQKDFSGILKAFTYPDEFLEFDGYAEHTEAGIFFGNQPRHTFGLSYRTLLGDDLGGLERGYKIHVLYNLSTIPSDVSNKTLSDSISPTEFSWDIQGVPEVIANHRETGHLIFDSTKMIPEALIDLEDILYGTSSTGPTLPSFTSLLANFVITITDNGDGTWTATGPDYLLTMLDTITFQIDYANVIYLNDYTYTVSSS